MGVVLSVLEKSWYYVANVAMLDESQRTMWKNGLFGSALVVMGVCAIWVSLRSKETWWRSTAGVTGIAISMIPVFRVIVRIIRHGIDFGNRPFGNYIAGMIFFVVCLQVISLTLALALGGLARITAKFLFSENEINHSRAGSTDEQ
jgi:hypothetical protein